MLKERASPRCSCGNRHKKKKEKNSSDLLLSGFKKKSSAGDFSDRQKSNDSFQTQWIHVNIFRFVNATIDTVHNCLVTSQQGYSAVTTIMLVWLLVLSKTCMATTPTPLLFQATLKRKENRKKETNGVKRWREGGREEEKKINTSTYIKTK